jgi:hypothetical protein
MYPYRSYISSNFASDAQCKASKQRAEGFETDTVGLNAPEFGPYKSNKGFSDRRDWFRYTTYEGVEKY